MLRVKIDCFPESAARYLEGYAIVVIDVVRATTTAITAVAAGHRCYPVPTIEAAHNVARMLCRPLLAGEQKGIVPPGFDVNNSPAEIARLSGGTARPVVLLSSSGTRLCHAASRAEAVFLACLRNHGSLAAHIGCRFNRVAVIGAGTQGQFREEDQLCCSWVAEGLIKAGYEPEDHLTAKLVSKWSKAPPDAWLSGNSAKYLRRTGQLDDLAFVLSHINDLQEAFILHDGEVLMGAQASARLSKGLRSSVSVAH